jgi:uncharacterized protein (TIGR02646 family)
MISVKKDFNDIPTILLTNKKNAYEDVSVLNKLKKIYHNKCAYCEQKLEEIEIDHYRPILMYNWLENEWSNLLPSCHACNKSKNDKFPILNKQIKEEPQNSEDKKADSELLLSEKPTIIHPEVDTPENHFYFDKSGIIYGNTERGQKNITILNLNRQDILQKRKQIIDNINEQINKVEINNLSEDEIAKSILNVFINLDKISEDENQEFTLLKRQIINHFPNFYFDSTNDKKNKLLINVHKEYLLLKHDIKNIQSNKNLPIAIHGFRIRNFQGIKDVQISSISLESNFIFLTGENASGKTSVLKALLIGFVGDKELKQNEISEDSRIELMYKKDKEFIISEFRGNYHTIEKNVAGYGTIRILLTKEEKPTIPITNSLFEKGTDLLNIEKKLIELHDGNTNAENKKKNIIDLLKNIIPNLYDIKIEKTDYGSQVIYYEKNSDNPPINKQEENLRKVSFSQLAAGMRSLIGIIGDMLIRFMENQPEIKSIKDYCGVVFIDEIENHLHPNWQRYFITKLSENFKKIQFVIATHSPIIFLGAPPNSYYLKLERNNLEAITIKDLSQHGLNPSNLLPNSLLTSPYFNFQKLIPESNKNLKDLRTEETYHQIIENDEIQRRLEEIEKDSKNFPDDLFKIK